MAIELTDYAKKKAKEMEKKEAPLGTGTASKARKALKGRAKQLKQQECKALGVGYNQTTGRCDRN